MEFENLSLPDTDSPEVMEQAVSLMLTSIVWEQLSRVIHPDEAEEALTAAYARVFEKVKEAHTAK